MNERIRELIIKTWGIPRDNFLEMSWDLEQKFAELIVRECAGIANKQFSAASGLDDRDSWTAAEIKKHFGVEE